MTDFIHEPVLLEEVLEALSPVSGGLYVDGTVGGGGHSEAILEACSPEGRLVAFDRDDWALEAAAKRLARFGNRLELHPRNHVLGIGASICGELNRSGRAEAS